MAVNEWDNIDGIYPINIHTSRTHTQILDIHDVCKNIRRCRVDVL